MPVQDIVEWAFDIGEVEEPTPYEQAELEFDTDYDRENIVTKEEAIQQYRVKKM